MLAVDRKEVVEVMASGIANRLNAEQGQRVGWWKRKKDADAAINALHNHGYVIIRADALDERRRRVAL